MQKAIAYKEQNTDYILMRNQVARLDIRGIRDAVIVLAKELTGKNGRDIPSGVCISGLDAGRLTRMSIDLGRKLDFPVYTQEKRGIPVFDAGDYLLRGWAYRQNERFCSPGNQNRKMIVVRGKQTGQRQRAIHYLTSMVEVFVEPEEQYVGCDKEGVYVAFFRDF